MLRPFHAPERGQSHERGFFRFTEHSFIYRSILHAAPGLTSTPERARAVPGEPQDSHSLRTAIPDI